MGKSIKQEGESARFRQDIRSLLRTRVREAIEITLEEELAEALGCDRCERSGERVGYRNGKPVRRFDPGRISAHLFEAIGRQAGKAPFEASLQFGRAVRSSAPTGYFFFCTPPESPPSLDRGASGRRVDSLDN